MSEQHTTVPVAVSNTKANRSVGNVPLPEVGAAEEDEEPCILPFPAERVKCRERLGGLLKHYYRAAA